MAKKQFQSRTAKALQSINLNDHVKFRVKSDIPPNVPNREYLFKTLAKVIENWDKVVTIEYPNKQKLEKVAKSKLGVWREQLRIDI